MRTAGERFASSGVLLAAGAAALCACALLVSGGDAEAPLVWIGALALGLAAVLRPVRIATPGVVFLSALAGLAVWQGVSTSWSISPDASWIYTNRTVVYVAFAIAGALVAAVLPRPATTLAAGAAVLLGAVIGWALLARSVPSLYADYARVARLRSPVAYWNELALLAAVAVPLGLWLAAPRTRRASVRAAGVLLVFGATLAALLTYSRFGVILAALAAVAWIWFDRDRVESLIAVALGGAAGAIVFGVALALPGIAKDGQPRSVRAHDGWIFGLVTLAAAAIVYAVAIGLARREAGRPLAVSRRRAVERAAAVAAIILAVAAVASGVVFAGRIWNDFTNPISAQITNGPGHLGSASSSNRWRWWQEAWHAFTRHPVGGTGAATFQFTDQLLRTSNVGVDEPHNTPLQFLSETGIVGLVLYVAAFIAAGVGIVRTRRRAAGVERAAVTALGLGVAAFVAHMVVDKDWNYVATCGPLLLVAGALAGGAVRESGVARVRRRPLLAIGIVVTALAAAYSLAAPWLSQRALASASTISAVKHAHSYDPLSTAALAEWAAFEDVPGNAARAEQLYRKEVSLEPLNSQTWYDLGSFYAEHREWRKAYIALSNAWAHDRFGPAGTPCGLLDQVRHEALGDWPPSCPGGRPASRP
ncbi:MAG TPA: O-antigen ligase family protein [Gaiellaceae bacterium]|nr:O-antigen ligase family protein [Gaiellaceae bacterium]